MREWVKATGAKVCIVFEGRDREGRHHQTDRRAGQPAGVPGDVAAADDGDDGNCSGAAGDDGGEFAVQGLVVDPAFAGDDKIATL